MENGIELVCLHAIYAGPANSRLADSDQEISQAGSRYCGSVTRAKG